MEASGALRRATRRRASGPRLLLAGTRHRLPGPHDTARSRASSQRDGGRGAGRCGATPEPSIPGRSSRDRLAPEELRAAVAAVDPAARVDHGRRPPAVPPPRPPIRRGARPPRCMGLEHRAPPRDVVETAAGAEGAAGQGPATPQVHGIRGRALATVVPDGGEDPRGTARDRSRGSGQARHAPTSRPHGVLGGEPSGHRRFGTRHRDRCDRDPQLHRS